jgi:hypothetical protein
VTESGIELGGLETVGDLVVIARGIAERAQALRG